MQQAIYSNNESAYPSLEKNQSVYEKRNKMGQTMKLGYRKTHEVAMKTMN